MSTTILVPVNFHRDTHKTDMYPGANGFSLREWCHNCARWMTDLETSYPLTFGQNYSFTYREISDEDLLIEGHGRTAWWGEFIGVKMDLEGTLSVYLRLGGHAGNEIGLPLSSLVKITPLT